MTRLLVGMRAISYSRFKSGWSIGGVLEGCLPICLILIPLPAPWKHCDKNLAVVTLVHSSEKPGSVEIVMACARCGILATKVP